MAQSAEVTVRALVQGNGRTEGAARNVGATIDEIEATAMKLGTLFRRLDDQTTTIEREQNTRMEAQFSSSWIKAAHTEWRKGTAAASDLTRVRDLPARTG
jgi:hypothetical protein